MTITFTIKNDTDRSLVNSYECICMDEMGKGALDCHHCKGAGKVTFVNSQWEMNVANGNASLILSALAINNDDFSGEINATRLLFALARTSAERMVRATVSEGNCIMCGVSIYRAQEYLDCLKKIAMQAAKMDEPVQWG